MKDLGASLNDALQDIMAGNRDRKALADLCDRAYREMQSHKGAVTGAKDLQSLKSAKKSIERLKAAEAKHFAEKAKRTVQ